LLPDGSIVARDLVTLFEVPVGISYSVLMFARETRDRQLYHAHTAFLPGYNRAAAAAALSLSPSCPLLCSSDASPRSADGGFQRKSEVSLRLA
jgi:hypothetical protein